jgi:hypothetical protein
LKKKQIKKRIKSMKIAIKRIRIKLDRKIKWNKIFKDEIEKQNKSRKKTIKNKDKIRYKNKLLENEITKKKLLKT